MTTAQMSRGVDAPFRAMFDRLHEEAVGETGFDDFGPADYTEGLRVLLDALDAGPSFSPFGRSRALEHIRVGLTGRLHTHAGWRKHPESLQGPFKAPVIIMGVPRSGTTALHKLMAMDGGFQNLERWLRLNPVARPPRDRWMDEPLYRLALERHEAVTRASPDAHKAHPVAPDEPDECLAPMSQSFISNWWGSQYDAPDYDSWFFRQDETASYRRYADILRLVGLYEPEKRWLLKNPSHIMGIDAMLAAYPDACVIHTVRHPSETMASLANLMANLRGPLLGQSVNRETIARREIGWYSEAVRRTMAATDRNPHRIFSVDFRRLVSDPLSVVQEVYGFFGMELSAQAEGRMRQWVADNPQDKHGVHQYRKLRQDEVAEAFAGYIERYDL